MGTKKSQQTMITKKQYNRKSPSIILEDCDCEKDCSWQLNRVSSENLLSTRPAYAKLVREFRGFENRPHLTLAHVGFNSGLRANWECEDCGNTWNTAVASRSDGKRCRKCAMKESGHEQALRKATGNNHPFIDKAICVIKYPDIKPKDLPPHSNLDVLWACRCGMEFIATIDHVLAYGVTCSTCRVGGTSRFEYEIYSLLQAYLPNLNIKTHYKKDSYKKFVDIYVEQLDLVIEIDTRNYHAGKAEIDQRILKELQRHYRSVLRVREAQLPFIAGSLTINSLDDVKIWAEMISRHPLVNKYRVHLDRSQIENTLTVANNIWDSRIGLPEISAESAPDIKSAFMRNLKHPGRKLLYTSIGSNDSAEFTCLETDCINVYPQRINRWVQGIRCPLHKSDHIRQGRLNGKGNLRLSDTHPEIFAELTRVVEDPTFPIDMVSPATKLMCEFRCSKCHHVWEMRPAIRTAPRSPAGCPECKKRRGFNRPVPLKKQLMIAFPEMLTEYVGNISTPDRPLERLSITSSDECEWACKNGKHPHWVAPPVKRTRLQKWRICPQCFAEKFNFHS